MALRREHDPRMLLRDVYGLSNEVANAIARHLEEHSLDSFQVPDSRRILVEQVISGAFPTYMITTCRGRGFNTALGVLHGWIGRGQQHRCHRNVV